MDQSGFQPNILILNSNADVHITLTEICASVGSVYSATDLKNTLALIRSRQIHVFITDIQFADFSNYPEIPDSTSIIITGEYTDDLENKAKEWPMDIYVDFHPLPQDIQTSDGFLRAINTAVQHSSIRNELEDSRQNLKKKQDNLELAISEISRIKAFIAQQTVKELEKRIKAEAKYKWFQKEKQKIEAILKKLYTAADFNSLLGIIYDAKELIQASGISIYLQEEIETQGTFLKPVVWDDAILSPPDFIKHIVPIDSNDVAAMAGRRRETINVLSPDQEEGISPRYTSFLKVPLDSLLCVPLLYKDTLIGVLEAYNKVPGSEGGDKGFNKNDMEFLHLLSEHIAIAITKLNLIQYDALTALLRPDPFFSTIIQKLQTDTKRRHEASSYALVMGDVDWFKYYNDRNGHEAGNRLLMELSQVLKQSIRENDLICRYGGEEFLLFLSRIEDIKEACRLTERIRQNVAEHNFVFQEFQPRGNLTMSFGVTVFSREKIESVGTSTKEMLKKIVNEADMAMAEAKSKKSSLLKVFSNKKRIPDKNRVRAYQNQKNEESKPAGPVETEPQEEQYKEKEKRRHVRYPVSTMVVYQDADSPILSRTINLSLGGVKIPTSSPLKLYDQLDLILILGEEEACQVQGEVVHSSRIKRNGYQYYSGLKFKNVPAKEKRKLEKFISGWSANSHSAH